MIKKIAFLLVLTYSSVQFSQDLNLEKYQYIIVPDQFSFLKSVDQYQTSSLTKFLFEKKGFNVFLSSDKLPKELVNNRCNALTASVKDDSSMLRIKVLIEITDCYSKTLYTSEIGGSKLKDYKRGYQEAIKKAFETMSDFEYSYNPNNKLNIEVPIVAASTTAITKAKNSVVKANDSLAKSEIVSNDSDIDSIVVLYAQPKDAGFQLINTKPEVVFTILKTSKQDYYIIKNKNGTLYKKDTIWIAEYYKNGEIIKEKYQIKF